MRLNLCFKIHALRVEWAQSMKLGGLGAREGLEGNVRNIFMIIQTSHPSPSHQLPGTSTPAMYTMFQHSTTVLMPSTTLQYPSAPISIPLIQDGHHS